MLGVRGGPDGRFSRTQCQLSAIAMDCNGSIAPFRLKLADGSFPPREVFNQSAPVNDMAELGLQDAMRSNIVCTINRG